MSKTQGTGGPAPPFSARFRRRRRFSRLGSPCQAVLRKELFDSVTGPEVGGGGDVVASDFRVKWFFLKKNLGSRCGPGGLRRRLPKEADPRCQPGFSAILRTVKLGGFGPQKITWREARGCPLSSDRRFDWSAETIGNQPRKQEIIHPCLPVRSASNRSPKALAASPSPSEGAIYGPALSSATRFLTIVRRISPIAAQPAAM